jgi:hypothetical protein
MLLGGMSMNYIGDLKSLRLLWTNLAKTSYNDWVTQKDIETFESRSMNEGLGFLTIVLPTLGKALDNYHSISEWVCPPDFVSEDGYYYKLLSVPEGLPDLEDTESRFRVNVRVPIFLGRVIKSALEGDSSAVDCVRQLSYIFYKLKVDYDETTKKDYLDRFIETDLGLPQAIDIGDDFTAKLIAEMRRIIGRILCNEDPLDIRPCHGSGATACRTSNSEKYHTLRYYPKLDAIFPYSDYFFYSFTHLSDELGNLEVAKESVPQARVCLVPKDSRGPRIISCEPAELLYIQQGLMRKLYRAIETHPLTAGQVNFTDQSINQSHAMMSSMDGMESTIDLSDASDRVSLDLIRAVFPPRWVEALEACRSESTLLPDGRIVKLNKFAPMGSSCCFPVEALVFWTCVQATHRMTKPHSRVSTYVYGDDIIVPSSCYEDTVYGLQKIGLVVNLSKSYFEGPCRESCGGEYHLGVDVTPVRIRKPLERQGSGLATCADLANNFVSKFGYDKALPLIQVIEEELGYVFPRTDLELPLTIRTSPRASNDVFLRRRWNLDFQRWEHRILSLTSTGQLVHPPDWGELLRKELVRDTADSGKYSHPLAILDSKVDPGYYTDTHSVRTKWAWAWLGLAKPAGPGLS